MAQASLRWESCAWADAIWWAQQQIKVMTATATYLARVTQAFVGAAAAEAAAVGSEERSAGETDEQTGQATTVTLVKRADAVPIVADAPSEPAVADAPYVPTVVTADAQAGATPEEELPVARWDELSLGSIRARLPRLSEADLAHLHRYEAEHAGRPAVLSMLANRLPKIRAEADSATASGDCEPADLGQRGSAVIAE
jgi:hypothetical protein